MNQSRISILNGLAVIFIINSILVASFRSYFHFSHPGPGVYKNLWVAPILELIIYFLFAFFIKHPHLLVKKQLADFEAPNTEAYEKTVVKWKNWYCYLRFLIIFILNLLLLFPKIK